MKKVIKKLIILYSLVMFVGTFSACRGGLYMEDFVDVQWACSEIKLQFTYTAEDSEKGTGTLIKDKNPLKSPAICGILLRISNILFIGR